MATTRRELLVAGIGATTLLACRHGAAKAGAEEKEDKEEVTPAEDLMREHGVLRRILLVYGEAARRLQANEPVPGDALASSAAIVKKFVHDYHEQLEEQHLFPRFEAANQQVELVAVLRAQHKAGAVLTERIRAGGGAGDATTRSSVIAAIRDFTRMYEPHAAREDTVLFPALIGVVGHEQYEQLGEQFEDEEHRRFGARGFAGIVDEVAAIETSLGIADLATFTPKV
jgi:hemerythrin-like domain-containing protein